MEKRYQIFVSSTFADLENERKIVMHALQKAGYFVAAMELFPSDDKDSWEVIKRVIDQSDYYVLVIAGRYGTLAPDGISFTEKEYHYAREQGIPVLAFLHGDRSKIEHGKSEVENKDKLEAFIRLVQANHNRTAWINKDELAVNVLASLSQRANLSPRIGWVRGDVRTQFEELQKERDELRKERDQLRKMVDESSFHKDIAWGEDKVTLEFVVTIDKKALEKKCELTWNAVFDCIGPKLLGSQGRWAVAELLQDKFASEEGFRFRITDASLEAIRCQLLALGLLEVQNQEKYSEYMQTWRMSEYWELSPKGKVAYSLMVAQRKESMAS